jgi:hypothetical protein
VAGVESGGSAVSGRSAGCVGGCLVVIVGLLVGVAVEGFAQDVIANSWSYCFNLPWPMAYDEADSPRFYIFEYLGWALPYCACLPAGVWIAWRVLAARGRGVRVVAGLLAGAVLLSAVLAGDLMLNITARDGISLPARCPAGHPPWWPEWLPARDSPAYPPWGSVP